MSTKLTREEVLKVVAAAEAKIGEREVNGPSNDDTDQSPRFIVFHSPFSVCSEKVRTILNATGVPWIGHAMDVKNPYNVNYSPEYVSLRKAAWLQLGEPPLAGEDDTYEWTGSSSVAANGLDLCVVPTLVDLRPSNEKGLDGVAVTPKVIVDSEVICNYLVDVCDESTKSRLLPPGKEAVIEKHLNLVDDMPHVAYLYDGNPIDDRRPFYIKRAAAKGVMHGNQVQALEKVLGDKGTTWDNDPILERAYIAKLNKTKKGAEKSKNTSKEDGGQESYVNDAYEKGRKVLAEMEADLTMSTTGWIADTEEPTLADYMQGVSMHRLVWLGMGPFMFDDFPKTKAYLDKVFALKELQDAVIFDPGMAPSHGTSYLFDEYEGGMAAFWNDRKVDMASIVAYLLV